MTHNSHHIQTQKLIKRIEYMSFFFKWVYLFYPKAKGIQFYFLLYYFFPQKILRINGRIPWPVHFTSRILYYKNIQIGNRSAPGMSPNCYIQGRNGIILGHNVRIGPGVGLISANHDPDDYDLWPHSSPIKIGNNVWIGMNTVILPGVHIGDNVIIGANSVVSKNIASNSIVTGNPCRFIREKSLYSGKDYSKI